MFKRIYRELREAGLDVYSAGQHAGVCRAPYVVIKAAGQKAFLVSLIRGSVEILAYYPADRFSEIEEFLGKVKAALKGLRFLKDTGEESPTYLDERKRAYCVGLRYEFYKCGGGK